MDRIVCLVGESGSGKSTIAEELEKKGYNYIQSYTTRPKRHENEQGHIFVTNPPDGVSKQNLGLTSITSMSKEIIAYTHFNNHHYWATREQYEGKGNSVYVIDPSGVKKLRDVLWNECIDSEVDIIAVYLKVDEKERHLRMLNRAKKTSDSQLQVIRESKKIKERIRHDREKFKVVACDYMVDANRPFGKVLEDVIEIIEQ